jgi:4-hydroxy-tetrahydrodipicolinate synthase
VFGVHTALVTPFRGDGAVDHAAFERLVQRQLDAGIHGLVPCGTTGETPTLSEAEQAELIRRTVAMAGGRPVTAGVGTNDTRTTVAKVEATQALGVQAGLLVFPYYNKPNPAGLRAHVREALRPGLPLVLYHVPGRTGQRISPQLLAELCSFEGVIGVKEATGDLLYGGELLTRTTTPVLSGDDFTFLPLLAMGGVGVISVVSNVAPRQTLHVVEAFRAGRVDEAAAAMRGLWALVAFLFSDVNPVPTKAALAALGLCEPHARLPLAAFEGPIPAGLLEGVA